MIDAEPPVPDNGATPAIALPARLKTEVNDADERERR
jgi:hypothetical protein